MIHATTILAVRHQDRTCLAGDGQVTFGTTVLKQGARKIRRLYNESILAGFAGSAADSFALFSRFESKLEQYRGNLERAAVELARDWRTDRLLRRLEAMMIVADRKSTFLLSGTGDLIEPDDGIVAVGSGGPFAMAAARALARHSQLTRAQIAEEAMAIAADICIYTNPQPDDRRTLNTAHGYLSSRTHRDRRRCPDAARDRRRARQVRHRSGEGEARGGDRACATASAGSGCRRRWPTRSRRRTS